MVAASTGLPMSAMGSRSSLSMTSLSLLAVSTSSMRPLSSTTQALPLTTAAWQEGGRGGEKRMVNERERETEGGRGRGRGRERYLCPLLGQGSDDLRLWLPQEGDTGTLITEALLDSLVCLDGVLENPLKLGNLWSQRQGE